MKHFMLAFFLSLSVALTAYAQAEEDALLPDFGTDEVQIDTSVRENLSGQDETVAVEQTVEENEALVDNEDVLPSQEDEKAKNEEEENDEQEKKIYLALTNIENTLAPVRAVSFCSGTFVVFNDTKKTVQEISGSFTIGDQTKSFKFPNVGKGQSVGTQFQLVGKSCESLKNISVPDIKFDKCQIQGMRKEKCLEKLVFVPIPR